MGAPSLLPIGSSDGFRVFKLAESCISEWISPPPSDVEALSKTLALSVHHLRGDRTDQDVLYEILLRSGFRLSESVVADEVSGRRLYSVLDGAFLVCLARKLDLELLRLIASRKPQRVTVLDEGFGGSDQLKANAVQIFKAADVAFRTM